MNRLQNAVKANGGRTLLGAAMYFYDPIFLEIAAHLGYQAIWIEMEHAGITFAEAADLCRMAVGTGMVTMIRVPDSRRENVLKAAECGPDIIDVPMVETPEQMLEMRKYARFSPDGERGCFTVSRAMGFGSGESINDRQLRINGDLCLMGQIETMEAVERLDDLVAVPGVDLFVGPGDLAASFGHPGETAHPKVLQAAAKIVKAARAQGKSVASACGPADFGFWIEQEIDLLFCTNDIACLKRGAGLALEEARALLPKVR